ncbi:hypothetical protein MMC13_002437 [Lambiella insularis]|nr:hypothetical protein [Lambiella insularis]
MADPTPSRKSARARVPSKKYSNDAFEILNITGLDSDTDTAPVPFPDDSEEDEDFQSDAVAEEPDDDEGSVISSDNASDASDIATLEEGSEDALSYTSDAELRDVREDQQHSRDSLAHPSGRRPRQGIRRKPDADLRMRGIPAPEIKGSRAHLASMFGTDPKDVRDFTQARKKWARDSTLPSRKASKDGSGGMALPFHCSMERYRAEATTKWDWYYTQGGKQEMAKMQNAHSLDPQESGRFMSWGSQRLNVLLGPYGNQKMYSISPATSLSLKDVWKPEAGSGDESAQNRRREKERNGWLLNAGAKIRSLDWAPNHGGVEQYLAIATNQQMPPDTEPYSAFESSGSFPACIQLWAFKATSNLEEQGKMDMAREPELAQVVCTEWGLPKEIRWSPAPREWREEESQETVFIGLLAGIWSDGYVRVLDIRLDKSEALSSIYATDLAVGCANGFVAIWDLADAIPRTKSRSSNTAAAKPPASINPSEEIPRPHFYHCLHQTYVLSLASTFPCNFHFLVSTSMDGYLRLTDIHQPTVDFVFSQRSRNMNSALDYHPHIQSFVAPEDSDFIQALPLRRFFSIISFAKAPGQVMCIAVGKVHASTLTGSADGTVFATNPLRKVSQLKASQYQQTWFRHEWAPTPKAPERMQSGDSGEDETGSNGRNVPREGTSRITEGYKVESLRIIKTEKGNSYGNPYVTIHEEETGITQVAWNPNLHCGGWAAAGMGTGLVRVEDLAI